MEDRDEFYKGWGEGLLRALADQLRATQSLEGISRQAAQSRETTTWQKDLRNLLDKQLLVDTVLRSSGAELEQQAHSTFLTVRSAYFRGVLARAVQSSSGSGLEDDGKVIDLPSLPAAELTRAIQCIYGESSDWFFGISNFQDDMKRLFQQAEENGDCILIGRTRSATTYIGSGNEAISPSAQAVSFRMREVPDDMQPAKSPVAVGETKSEDQPDSKQAEDEAEEGPAWRLPAHRFVLAARSEFLRALMAGGWQDGRQINEEGKYEIQMPPMSEEVAKCLHECMYTPQCLLKKTLSMVTLKELHAVAVYLNSTGVRQATEDAMVSALERDVRLILSTIQWSSTISDGAYMRRACLDQLRRLGTRGDDIFDSLPLDVFTEYLCGDDLGDIPEGAILNRVLRWLHNNFDTTTSGWKQSLKRLLPSQAPSELEKVAKGLLSHVRFSFITPYDLEQAKKMFPKFYGLIPRAYVSDLLRFRKPEAALEDECHACHKRTYTMFRCVQCADLVLCDQCRAHQQQRKLPPEHEASHELVQNDLSSLMYSSIERFRVRLRPRIEREVSRLLDDKRERLLHAREFMVCRMFHPTNGRDNFGPSPLKDADLTQLPPPHVMEAMLREESRLRLLPEIQEAYAMAAQRSTEVTNQLQLKVVREAGLPDSAVHLLRGASRLYPDNPAMREIPHYVKYNRSKPGHLTVGSAVPNCRLASLTEGQPDAFLHSFFRADYPLVLIGGSIT